MENSVQTPLDKEKFKCEIVDVDKIPAKDLIVDVPLDDPIKVYNICLELKELCEKENGIGISAVQVGIPWNLFLVRGDGTCPLVPKGEFGYFVNCKYEETTNKQQVVSLEGCLSLRSPDGRLRSFQVERQFEIRILGYQLFVLDSILFKELDAIVNVLQEGIVFQHEIDHQLGTDGLISHKGKEIFVW
jgi:peptide deformylase